MVKSHALMLVPISKLSCFAQAFIRVSCTRSSALSCLPESDIAKARRLGRVASNSLLNDGDSGLAAPALLATAVIGGLHLCFVELLEEVEKVRRNRLLLGCSIERPQLGSDIGVCPK